MSSRNSLTGKWIGIIIQVIIWSLLFLVPFYFANRYMGDYKPMKWMFGKATVIYGIIFYINYLVLVPQLFFKVKRLYYIAVVLLLIGLFYFISIYTDRQVMQILEPLLPADHRPGPGGDMMPSYRFIQAFNYLMGSSIFIFLSLGLGILKRQTEIEKKQKEMEREKLNSELAFLKSQISPHFLFNTLNNIYSLIGINTGDAQDAVLKLSKLMRYMLDESEQTLISLGREIEFMNNYIDLMKLRLVDKVELKVDFPKTNLGIQIPPLLFIPFIENTFKHGVSYRGESNIEIGLMIGGKELTFTCRNRIFHAKKVSPDLSESGIGLDNARKRLQLLFPNQHELRITQTEDDFNVFLHIRINGAQK